MSSLFRRKSNTEHGFTLMELMTVIIVIGILAAVAIPVFSSQRSRAQDTQTKSDVRNLVTAAETFLSDRTKTFTDLTDAELVALNVKTSPGVRCGVQGGANGYCIAAYNVNGKAHANPGTALTYDSSAGGFNKSGGSCTGPYNVTSGSGTAFVAAAAPGNFNVTRADESSSVTLNWDAVTGATSYKVEAKNMSTNATSTVATVNAPTRTATVTTLTGGVQYTLSVTATTPQGDSAAATSVVTPRTVLYDFSVTPSSGSPFGGNSYVDTNPYYSLPSGQSAAIGIGCGSHYCNRTSNVVNVTIPAGGATIKYFSAVSSESCCDRGNFIINGSIVENLYDNNGFTAKTQTLAAGNHTLQLGYQTDGSVINGSSTYYVAGMKIISN